MLTPRQARIAATAGPENWGFLISGDHPLNPKVTLTEYRYEKYIDGTPHLLRRGARGRRQVPDLRARNRCQTTLHQH